MKKLIPFLFLILFSCTPEDKMISDPDSNPDPVDENSNGDSSDEIGFGDIPTSPLTYQVNLPTDYPLESEDLTVSTLIDESGLADSQSIQIFDSSEPELVFVTDNSGRLVLLSFVNPNEIGNALLDSETTALALLMLHPWVMNFSSSAKAEAIEYIKSFSEYPSFLQSVENAIVNGSIESLEIDDFIEEIIQSKIASKKEEIRQEKNPLELVAAPGSINLKNKGNIMGYGVRLYNEQGNAQEEFYYLQGEKELFLFDRIIDLFVDNTGAFAPTEIDVPIPFDANWTVVAKNGLPLSDNSDENRRALYQNLGRFAANGVGLVSPSLKRVFQKSECLLEIGLYLSGQFSQLLNDFYINKDQKSLLRNTLNLFAGLATDMFGIIEGCSAQEARSTSFFGKLRIAFKRIAQIDRIENGAQLAMFFNDWAFYENQEEFCLIQKEDEVFYCEGVTISGDLQFGEIPIGGTASRNLSVTNNLETDVTIKDITLPNGFTSNNQSVNIPPESSIELSIVFEPTLEIEYSGIISIKTDAVTTVLEVNTSGTGITPVDDTDLLTLLLEETDGFWNFVWTTDENDVPLNCSVQNEFVYPNDPSRNTTLTSDCTGLPQAAVVQFYSDFTTLVVGNTDPDIYDILEMSSSFSLENGVLTVNTSYRSSPKNDNDKFFSGEMTFTGVYDEEQSGFVGSYQNIYIRENYGFINPENNYVATTIWQGEYIMTAGIF